MTSSLVPATVSDEPTFTLWWVAHDDAATATGEESSADVKVRPEVTSDEVSGLTPLLVGWTPVTEKVLKLMGGGLLEEADPEACPPKWKDPKVPEMLVSFSWRPPDAPLTPFTFSISATVVAEKVPDPAAPVGTSCRRGCPAWAGRPTQRRT